MTLADAMRREDLLLQQRFIFHTMPKGPVDLEQAIKLSEKMGNLRLQIEEIDAKDGTL